MGDVSNAQRPLGSGGGLFRDVGVAGRPEGFLDVMFLLCIRPTITSHFVYLVSRGNGPVFLLIYKGKDESLRLLQLTHRGTLLLNPTASKTERAVCGETDVILTCRPHMVVFGDPWW